MNKEVYKGIIRDSLTYSVSGHNLQHIINNLIKNNIATYSPKAEKGIIIKSSDEKDKRIKQCLKENEDIFYEIERMFVDKAYRYAIYFKCDEFIINDKISGYTKIEDFKMAKHNKINDFLVPRYFENDKLIAFVFCKTINPYIAKLDATKDVMYNTLWIYHKDLKILEHRFDILGFKSDDEFYETTFNPQLDRLTNDFGIKVEEFRTTSLIEYIVENKKSEVHEISKYMGLKGNSLARLKVGSNLVMPFIGDLELIMTTYEELLDKTDDTKKIKEIITKYITDTKENANYKSRLLAWYDKDGYFLNINITFSYRNKPYDLLNFLEPKNNNMEMMNYATKYIWQINRDISGDE